MCFHCREPGHGVADCPAVLESQDMGTGICYRCGSTEHDIGKCKAKIDPAVGMIHKLAFCGVLWSEISYYWYVDLCSSNLSVLKTEINMFKGIQYCDNKPDVAVMLSYKYHTVSYSVFRVVCGYAMFLTFVINNGILQVHFHMQNASSVVRWDIYQGHVLTIPKDCMPKVSAVIYCSWNIFFLLTWHRTK